MRVRKPEEGHHLFRATDGNGEILLVAGGKRAYLWAGGVKSFACFPAYTFSGRKSLRALAEAILAEVPE